jgi:eukaryotic-like serine/threonine-protein kinase
VSWYEAAAYARFAQKSLPTVYHWYRAAGSGLFSDILAFSNFKGRGAAAAGANDGLSPFGSYDMAGNVKEWAQNAVGERRYLLGGGWDEGSIKFSYPDAGSPLDRNRTVGFRCASYEAPLGEDLVQNIDFFSLTSRTDPPVDAQTFQIYRDLNSYDKEKAGPLQPEVVVADDSSPYFRREDISFRAAYGNELVLAHLYLPKNAAPPFQPIVFFGSGDMLDARSIAQLHDPFEFIVRSGRALVIPAYQGTLERGPMPSQPRETMLNWPKDLGRSLDYLETRSDMDVKNTGYFGYSYGAHSAPRMLAVEPRIRTAVLVSGGAGGTFPGPEVDPWNFIPRVQIPVLMLNGRDDFGYPLVSSQLPLFGRLGTPAQDKKHIPYDGGHINLMFRMDVIKEVLEWYDRYLGPVSEPR